MNNQTFEEFYLKYRKISRGYAYGVLHDWSAADDVSQDVLYKMYTIKDGLNIDNEKMMLHHLPPPLKCPHQTFFFH